MQNPTNMQQNIALAKATPSVFLKGETPLLIDEWQVIPFIWDSTCYEIDKRGEFNQFILTGSSSPSDLSLIHHSGLGRIASLLLRPMSLYESLDSSGQYSISDLFRNIYPSGAVSNHTITDYAYLCCRGDWAAIEIKLYDDDAIHDAAKKLLRFKEKINLEQMKEPSFLMIVTGTSTAYQREDGVFVVPIDCLKN